MIVAGRLINHVWLENNLTVMAIKAVVAIVFILVTKGGDAHRNEAPVSASSAKDHWVGFAADVLTSSFASCFRASLACWRSFICSTTSL